MSRRLYVFKSGRLSRKQNTIFIEQEDGTKNYIPIENVSEIHCFGNLDFNKDALEFLTQNGIPLHLYNHYEYYIGTYYPREYLESGELILQQVEYYKSDEKRLDLARRFVQGSIENMLAVISYYKNRGKDLLETEIKLKAFLDEIFKTENVDVLMGLEGNSRNTYYSAFDKIIDNSDFPFVNRTRQPPSNEVNALISFGNSIIYSTVLSEIYKTHLDPRIGYLHTTNFRRFSLNLDVAEIFKPIIVDRSIFSLINKRIITKNDFSPHLQGIYMNENGKKKFVEEIENQLSTTISHPKIKKKVSYKYLIRLELYKLEKHFLGDKEYIPYISKW
ncbi:MAG: type I-B CRISPR-associated endonuclease Cas1b [Thermotogae bacterium]|jgi:CRISPR-associated protein Cas1|nr:type I-B CRISPR-associated endonuclease Cas1b [Thermotogota bacterium]MCL5033298.1 type I-B CRISPR-associated endonuclease Cas1b [Thermotogota bacterium]